MERTFEAVLVEQCAPTLAGVKPASLFRWQEDGRLPAGRLVYQWARVLAPFGLAVRIVKTCPQTGDCLIYLYRVRWLRRILAEADNRAFLEGRGYDLSHGCSGLLEQLSHRLCLAEEFPHEIGVFLGYPLEDVVGFIENQGRNYTCCGCWKAYGDPEAARRCFACYRRCTEVYCRNLRMGMPVTRLIVAA
ncbi:MAG: DUF3793 family protein [Oscillibacter sp.]|nr:DUF3793 family protein [Oscillibacter sp.]